MTIVKLPPFHLCLRGHLFAYIFPDDRLFISPFCSVRILAFPLLAEQIKMIQHARAAMRGYASALNLRGFFSKKGTKYEKRLSIAIENEEGSEEGKKKKKSRTCCFVRMCDNTLLTV